MGRTLAAHAALLAALAPGVALAQPSGQADSGLTDVARDLFTAGVEAAKAGDWATCRSKQAAALKLNTHWQIAANLAECEAELGQHRDAAEHIALALRELPAGEAERKASAEALLARVKPFVAEVTITVEGDDAEGAIVTIGGAEVGKAPIAHALYLAPGPHEIAARGTVAQQATQLEAAAGGSHPVTLVLTRPVSGSNGGNPPPDAATTESPHPYPALVIGGAIVAVAALATGIGLHVAASGNDSDVDDGAAAVSAGGGTCTPVTAGFEAQCASIADALDAADGQRAVGTPLLIGGGVVGALVLGYALWPRGSAPAAAGHIELIPSVSPSVGGAMVRGRF